MAKTKAPQAAEAATEIGAQSADVSVAQAQLADAVRKYPRLEGELAAVIQLVGLPAAAEPEAEE